MQGGMDGEEEGCGREGRRAGSCRVADSTIAWHLTAGTATAQSRGAVPASVPWTGNYSQHPVPHFLPPQHPARRCLAPGGQNNTHRHPEPTDTQSPAEPRPAVGTAAVSPWQELQDSRRGFGARQTRGTGIPSSQCWAEGSGGSWGQQSCCWWWHRGDSGLSAPGYLLILQDTATPAPPACPCSASPAAVSFQPCRGCDRAGDTNKAQTSSPELVIAKRAPQGCLLQRGLATDHSRHRQQSQRLGRRPVAKSQTTLAPCPVCSEALWHLGDRTHLWWGTARGWGFPFLAAWLAGTGHTAGQRPWSGLQTW